LVAKWVELKVEERAYKMVELRVSKTVKEKGWLKADLMAVWLADYWVVEMDILLDEFLAE
jgi:hypothetical protein